MRKLIVQVYLWKCFDVLMSGRVSITTVLATTILVTSIINLHLSISKNNINKKRAQTPPLVVPFHSHGSVVFIYTFVLLYIA